MSIQEQVFEAVHAMAEALGAYAPLRLGALPEANGLCMAVAAGSIGETTLAGGESGTLDIVLNGKHENQSAAMGALCAIHEALRRAAIYPAGERWQVTAIRTGSVPGYLGREEKQWLYGSALKVDYCMQ